MYSKRKILLGTLVGMIVVLIFGAVTYAQLKVGDFQPHLKWAQQLGDASYLFLRANLLFQRFVLVVRDLLPFNFLARVSALMKQIIDIKSYDISAWIVTVSAYLATYYFVFRYIKCNISLSKSRSLIAVITAFVCMLVGPIFLLTYPDRQYLGYINSNAFHNPTYLLMKPFAVLFFIQTVESLYIKNSWKKILIASAILFLATLAKPSFTLSFIPSIFVVIVLWNYKKIKELNFRFILVSVLATSLFVLITQFIIMYTGSRGDRVLLSPFEAIMGVLPNIGAILVSALLSILFPLLTTIVYWKKVKSKISVQLVVVNFVIALSLAYLFTEQTDMLSLNFWWTPMMALFLWFLVAIPIYLNEIVEEISTFHRLSLKSILLSGLLLLHLVCGIIFYLSSLGPVSPIL